MSKLFDKFCLFALNLRNLFVIYFLLAVSAGIHSYLIGPQEFAGRQYTHYNNFLTFKYSYFHLIQNKDLYIEYPDEHWDYFKYSPTFALMMFPFAYLPNLIGLLLWNLVNSLILFFAIKELKIDDKIKALILWFTAIELLTSIQNEQSNGLIAGLFILSFVLFEKNKPLLATLLLTLSAYIKIFGVVGFILILLYPNKLKTIFYSIFWMILFAVAPLVVVSLDQLKFLYTSWMNLLQWDYSASLGLSVAGWLKTWFNLEPPKFLITLFGAIFLLLPLLKWKNFENFGFRFLYLALILIWVVIFNHKAESPTYVIAISGVAIWYFSQRKKLVNFVLLIFAFIFTSLSPTDLFPKFLRDSLVIPYVLKAVPCIFIWMKLTYEIIFDKFELKKEIKWT
ncbi:MAG: glycosyltransferase family 87 protein [Candidatus Kryptonium sp.]